MLLSELPYDILVKIFNILVKRDPATFLNLSRACKRLCYISRDIPDSVNFREARSEEKNRLVCYTIGDFLDLLPDPQAAEEKHYCSLEIDMYWALTPQRIELKRQLYLSETLSRLKLDTLVDLKLDTCSVTWEWLEVLLNEMPNLLFLTIDRVEVIFTSTDLHLRSTSEIWLRVLNLIRCGNHSDGNFNKYFFEYLEHKVRAKTLDISGFYLKNYGAFDSIHSYLKHNHSTVKCFNASYTEIGIANLLKLLRDEKLKHMKLKAKFCPYLHWTYRTGFKYVEKEQLIAELGLENYDRVEIESEAEIKEWEKQNSKEWKSFAKEYVDKQLGLYSELYMSNWLLDTTLT